MLANEVDTALLNKRVGAAIRQRRIDRRLAESDLARALGISRAQLIRYEQGVEPFELTLLHAAAQVLDARILDLLAAADRSQQPVRGRDEPADKRLLQAFGLIDNDRIRTAVLEWVEAIAASASQPGGAQPRSGAAATARGRPR